MEQEIFYRDVLLEELSRQSNIHISSLSDCHKLSQWLLLKGIAVSGFTIARICGLLASRKTYKSTFNLLAEGVGMHSWDNFIRYQKCLKEEELLVASSYQGLNSLTVNALELAIRNYDFNSLQLVTNKMEPISYPNILYVMRFGATIRSISKDKNYLQKLVENKVVSELLFNYFVDEDNPNNYYSSTLEYVLGKVPQGNNFELFSKSFLISQNIYNKLNSSTNLVPAWNPRAHFHVKSRTIECFILQKKSNKIKDYHTVLTRIFNELTRESDEAKRWILARSIRAFAHIGLIKEFISISMIKKELNNQFSLIQKEICSTADLIIQFVCIAHSILIDKKMYEGVPKRMKFDHLNETNERICIESSILLLLDENSSGLFESISQFSRKTGNSWISNVMNM